jgi:hypothetical protein
VNKIFATLFLLVASILPVGGMVIETILALRIGLAGYVVVLTMLGGMELLAITAAAAWWTGRIRMAAFTGIPAVLAILTLLWVILHSNWTPT